MYFIYIVENLINGKAYVGQTMYPEFRWKKHKKAGLDCPHLHRAIRKYGRKSFDFSLIQRCENLEEANTQEVYWISTLTTLSPNGYNLKEGGLGGGPDSLETREKKRLSKLGERNSFYGRNHSDESKDRISASKTGKKINLSPDDLIRRKTQKTFLGRKHSTATRIQLSKSHMGNQIGEKNPMFGKRHSEETKTKMREAQRIRWENIKKSQQSP